MVRWWECMERGWSGVVIEGVCYNGGRGGGWRHEGSWIVVEWWGWWRRGWMEWLGC